MVTGKHWWCDCTSPIWFQDPILKMFSTKPENVKLDDGRWLSCYLHSCSAQIPFWCAKHKRQSSRCNSTLHCMSEPFLLKIKKSWCNNSCLYVQIWQHLTPLIYIAGYKPVISIHIDYISIIYCNINITDPVSQMMPIFNREIPPKFTLNLWKIKRNVRLFMNPYHHIRTDE